MQDHSRLPEYREMIGRRLDELLAPASESATALDLREAQRLAVLAGGQRIRPLLVLLSCDAAGGDAADALDAACAVELVHAASLVLDDLPSMDDHRERRAHPTLHRRRSEALAILTGMALVSRAFELTAEFDRTRGAAATACLARAVGEAGMCGGQLADLLLVQRSRDKGPVDREALETMYEGKTARLMAAACAIGAMAGAVDIAAREALSHYGRALGLAYQIADDLRDFATDVARRRPNYASLLGSRQARARVVELLADAPRRAWALGIRTQALDRFARDLLEARVVGAAGDVESAVGGM